MKNLRMVEKLLRAMFPTERNRTTSSHAIVAPLVGVGGGEVITL